jgi:hypothetical protein
LAPPAPWIVVKWHTAHRLATSCSHIHLACMSLHFSGTHSSQPRSMRDSPRSASPSIRDKRRLGLTVLSPSWFPRGCC